MTNVLFTVRDDSEPVEIPRNIAIMSRTIKDLLEDMPNQEARIPLKTVTKKTLLLVKEWCEKHQGDALEEDLKKVEGSTDDSSDKWPVLTDWDMEFFKAMDVKQLTSLIQAVNYLSIEKLWDSAALAMGYRLEENKTPDGIRKLFGIQREFTKEEKIATMKKYPFIYANRAADDIPELRDVYQAMLETLSPEERAEAEETRKRVPGAPPPPPVPAAGAAGVN